MSENAGLKKVLSFWWLYAIGVGSVVGDGIFTFTGYGVLSAGPSMLMVYIVVGLLQLCLMISFGELAVWKPTSGGPEVWVRNLVDPKWGAVSSLLFSLGWIIAGGSTGLAIGAYTHNFLVHLGLALEPADLWISILGAGWLVLFAYLNVRGVDIAAKTQFVLVLCLVSLVVLYSIAVMPHVQGANFTPFYPNGINGTMGGIPIAVYAFMGASTVLFASEEAKNPVHVARVLLWSSLTFIIVYTAALFCAIGTLSMGEMEKFVESIYVTSVNKVYGPVFANALNAAAWIAAATCLLMGTIYQPSRDLFNLARSGYRVPQWLGYLHPVYRTPTRNIWLVCACAIALIILGQLAGQTMMYQLMAYLVVWFWVVSWILTLRAAIVFRQRFQDTSAGLPWRVPLWPLTPVVGGFGIALTIIALFQDLWLTYNPGVCIGFGIVCLVLTYGLRVFVSVIEPPARDSQLAG